MDKAEEQKKTKKLRKKVSFAEVDIIHGSDSDDSNELSEQSYRIDDHREEVSTDTCDSDSDEITDYGITACSSDSYDNILVEADSDSESESDSGVMDTPEPTNNNGSSVCEGEQPTVEPGVSSEEVDNANVIATSSTPDTSNTVDMSASDLWNKNDFCIDDNSSVEKGTDDANQISSASDMETSYESSARGEVSAMEISFVSETTELASEQTIEVASHVTSSETDAVAVYVDENKTDEPKAVCSDSDVSGTEPCPEDTATLDDNALLEDNAALGLVADEPAYESNNADGVDVDTANDLVDDSNDNISESQIDGNKDTTDTVTGDSPIVESDALVVTPVATACGDDIDSMSPTPDENDDNETSDVPMDNGQVNHHVSESEVLAPPLERVSPANDDIAVNGPVEVGDDIDNAPLFDTTSNEINEAPVNETNDVDGFADDATNTTELQDANVVALDSDGVDSDLNGDDSATHVVGTCTEAPAEGSVLGVAPCSQVANDADVEKSESIDQSLVEEKEGIDSDDDLMKETITAVNVAPIENTDESDDFGMANTEIESCGDEQSVTPKEMVDGSEFQAVGVLTETNVTGESSGQGIDDAPDTKYTHETQPNFATDTTDMVIETGDLMPADNTKQVEISAELEATHVELVESDDALDNVNVVEETNVMAAVDDDHKVEVEQKIVTNQTIESSVGQDYVETTTVVTTEMRTTVVKIEPAMSGGSDIALDSGKVNNNVPINETDSVADATKSDSELEVAKEESKVASCDETDPVGVNTESMSAPAGESSICGTGAQFATDIVPVVSNADVVVTDVGEPAVEHKGLGDQPALEEPTTVDDTAAQEVVDDVAESLLSSKLVTSDTAVCGTDGNTGDEIAELVDSDDQLTADLEIPVTREKEELQLAGGMIETVSTDDVDVETNDAVASDSQVIEDKLMSEINDESEELDTVPADTSVDNSQEGGDNLAIKQGDNSKVELATTVRDNGSSVGLDLNVDIEQESNAKDVVDERKATEDMVRDQEDLETDRDENRQLGGSKELEDKVDISDISNVESDDVINCAVINREASILSKDGEVNLSDKNDEKDFNEEIGTSVEMDTSLSVVCHETDTASHVEMEDEILSDAGANESIVMLGEKDYVPEIAVEDPSRVSDVPDNEDMSYQGENGEKIVVDKQDTWVKNATAEKLEESVSVSEIITVSSEETVQTLPSQEAMGVHDSEPLALTDTTPGESDSVVDTGVVCVPNKDESGDGRSSANATIGILSTEDTNLDEEEVVEPSSGLTPTNELSEASKDTQVWHGNPINGPGPCHSSLASSSDKYTVIDHGEVIHEVGSEGEESTDICYGTGTGTSTKSRFQDTSAVLFAQASSAYEYSICPTKIPDDEDTVCSDNTPKEETVIFPSSEPPVVVEDVIQQEQAPREEEIPNFVAVVDNSDIGQSHAEISRSEPIRIATGKAPDNKVDELHKLTIEITRSAELEPGASKLFDSSPLSELEDEDLELLERASNRASFVGSLDDLSPIDEVLTNASGTLISSNKDVTNGESKVDDYPDVDLSESVGLEYFTGGSSWSEYFQHFEAFCRAKKWNKQVKGSYLFAHLKGRAKQVACKLPAENQRDFDHLVATLGRFFTARDEAELYLFELRNRVRKPEERLRDLGSDVQRLTDLAYPEIPVNQRKPLARIHFMDALKDSGMLKHIYQGRPDTLEDAVKLAIEYEGFRRVTETSEVAKPRPKSIEEVVNGGDRSEMEKRLAELAKSIGEIKSTLGNADKSSAARDIS